MGIIFGFLVSSLGDCEDCGGFGNVMSIELKHNYRVAKLWNYKIIEL